MFELKVTNLRKYDKLVEEYEQQPIEKGMILFYGSSGFTRWKPKYGPEGQGSALRQLLFPGLGL